MNGIFHHFLNIYPVISTTSYSGLRCQYSLSIIYHKSIRPRAGLSLQNSGTKAAVLTKRRPSTANSGIKVAVLLGMNRCGSFPHLALSLASEQILKDLKRSQGYQCGGEESGFGNWALRTSPKFTKELNISSIKVFDQIRDPEIPIILRPK